MELKAFTQREQQAQRGSVKGPVVSGGGEKFRGDKAYVRMRVGMLCMHMYWGTIRE